MSVPEISFNVTVEDYLLVEESSEERHEFLDGHRYPMISSTYNHNVISLNIAAAFRSKLKDSGYLVFMNKFKVRIDDINCFYYPDVFIDCDPIASQSLFTKTPSVVVEVISESTSSIDTREKLNNYRRIDSLNEYLVVHQEKMHVEQHKLVSGKDWYRQEFSSLEDCLILKVAPNQPIQLGMNEIYEEVECDSSPCKAEQAEFDAVYGW